MASLHGCRKEAVGYVLDLAKSDFTSGVDLQTAICVVKDSAEKPLFRVSLSLQVETLSANDAEIS